MTAEPELETATVTPTEVRLRLRLKRSRFLLRIGDSQLGELQAGLDRVSKYLITRLKRKYRALAVSRPIWSIDPENAPLGMQKYAYCYFGYIDCSPYTDKAVLTLIPDATREVTIPMNRAMRRAQ